nr:glycerophosphodiester phosphodiesterase family protein [Candidatus Glomeribacter gigasporarum]
MAERLLTFPHLKQCTLMLLMTALSACAAIKKSHTPNDHASKALPLMIAHRAGTKDYPENTLLAINEALKNGADLIWVTVQLSKGGIPVLYQPADLSAWTEANGAVADKTLAELQQLNAGWNFVSIDADGNKAYPYRHQNVQIPTLKEALQLIPYKIPIILDMKALPASAEADRGYCTGA